MVGRINSFGSGNSAGNFAGGKGECGKGFFLEKEIIDPAIREMDRMGLNKGIPVIPGDPWFLGMKGGKEIQKSRIPELTNRKLIRLGIEVAT